MEILKKDTLFIVESERFIRRRIVTKLGSSTVCNDHGEVRSDLLQSLSKQTKELHQKGIDTVFVSSGAVAAGRVVASHVTDKELLSGIGQSWLSMAWNKAFYPTPVAQLLLTDAQLHDRDYIKKHIVSALDYGVVPVINSVNPDANNDFTGSLVASAIGADTYALLTTKNGVLRNEQTIPEVHGWSDLEGVITDETSTLGNGGMRPKCGAALQFVANTKGEAIIANGLTDEVLHKIAERHTLGTWFSYYE